MVSFRMTFEYLHEIFNDTKHRAVSATAKLLDFTGRRQVPFAYELFC